MPLGRPGFSTTGLMMLLAIWAVSSPRDGGFTKATDRAAAVELLAGFIQSGTPQPGQEPLKVWLVFDREWSVCWPRPQRADAQHERLLLEITPAGVDLAAWKSFAMLNRGGFAHQVWGVFGDRFLDLDHIRPNSAWLDDRHGR